MKRLVLFIMCCFFIISCGDGVNSYYFPKGATNIVNIDKSWSYFDLDGHTYLIGQIGVVSGRTMAITIVK